MNRWISSVDRVVVALIGLALVAVGAYAIAWDVRVEQIRRWTSRLDRPTLAALPDQPWWQWALIGTFAACLVIGIALLYLNLRRRSTEALTLRHNETGTDVSVGLGPVAGGVAAELAGLSGVRSTRHRATVDRGLPTVTVVATADPDIDVVEFTTRAERIARATNRSLDGSAVAVQILLHLDRVDSAK
ncbi:hypothetical protein ABH922_003326 [Rhodococcus sp. 27YEA15]|uniref:hypothetical protein n=1 Tax=Rhodococcus sp. 27YEA15 TaxID=3156259 RepID=UPI003C7CAF7A